MCYQLNYFRKLCDSISARAKDYYHLTCITENPENCLDDSLHMPGVYRQQSSDKNNTRIMFDSVTPTVLDNSKEVMFEVEMKKENGGLISISRTYQNFFDLHNSLKSNYPEDTPDIPDENYITKASELTELSYSLLLFLNKITKIDKIMFSEIFQNFIVREAFQTFFPAYCGLCLFF